MKGKKFLSCICMTLMLFACSMLFVGCDKENHTHEYIEQVNEQYLCTVATCESPATYYKSCLCGEKSTETFEYGEALGHNYSERWSFDSNGHWHECLNNGCILTSNSGEHTFNNEDICSVCGYHNMYYTSGLTFKYDSENEYYVVESSDDCCTEVIIPYWYNDGENGICKVAKIGKKAFYKKANITSITIPSSVTTIEEDAFSECSNLTRITIPNSVTSIGRYVFDGCFKLVQVKNLSNEKMSDWENPFYAEVLTTDTDFTSSFETSGNYTVFKNGYYKVLFSSNSSIKVANYMPSDITVIGYHAFENYVNLTSVTIPNSVTSIGLMAFYGCSGLSSVIIPENVENIENYAFAKCSGLTSVTIRSKATSIGFGAFENCANLTSVIIPSSITTIEENAFSICASLQKIYYTGTSEDWDKINIKSGNIKLTNATWYFYSWSEPTETGNYWHYKNGVPTVW